MKTNFIKKFMLLTAALAVAFGMNASTVFASAAINNAPNDLKTLRVSNYSAVPGSMTWSSTVNASAGQIVSVGIYYHNSGDQTLQNLRIQLTPQTTGAGTNHIFSTTLLSDNTGSVRDTAGVTIVGGAQSLSYIPTAVYWYPNQACASNPNCQPTALPLGQNGSELFGNGLAIGNLAPGWATQGGLTVQFKVSSDTTPPPVDQTIDVTTYAPTGLSDTTGSATLKGFVNPNGTTTSVWFKYRRNGGSWVETAHQSVGTTAQNFSRSLTGLPAGNYEYQAVANTTYHGDSKFFTLGDGGTACDPCDPCGIDYPCSVDNQNDPSVDTLSPTNIDTDSATLRGDLTDDGNDSNDLYFKWGTSSSNLNRTLDAGTRSSPGTFSRTLSGLSDNETYYYKACADNSSGTDCGSIESFDTDSADHSCDYYDTCDNGNDRPSVTTLSAYSIGSTSAVVDGYFTSNGCSTTTSFEYGRTNSLGSTTTSVNRGNSSGSMAYGFTSLASDTTYYYRAVASNCEGVTRGSIKSFTTTSRGTGPVNPVVYTGTGGSQFIKLMIDNHRETVRSGSDIGYDVSWENVTGSTLKNLVLQVNFDQMTVIDTDKGSVSHDDHSVIVEIESLGSHETGDMTITTKTTGNLKDGEPVVAQAIMAFENPKTSATENAIAYDSDEFTTRGSTLGASIFGLNLPTSLGGWLIILLIILLIIVLARHFMRQNQNHVVVNQGAPHPMDAAPAQATGNDYIVYRPTPNK